MMFFCKNFYYYNPAGKDVRRDRNNVETT